MAVPAAQDRKNLVAKLAAEFGGDECRRERQQSASGVCFEAGIQNEVVYVWSSAKAAVDTT
ncbi:hypothetical protein [Accumulibacter sp.]|uniref:hypothetical protein n=1 Tax=Accumulibacter sp. TaxID=2053492 RepID=UPI00262E5540|nr:hypothetical protein [Accumulibacter sp.]